ncbi:hypothetical protein [Ornithinibacillus halotolerans]|uniref:DUF4129 domain-containing protein n=1 Tax=Ornithinibacillus halotolerans TaxID=1274357 RepID=A0A916W912_9BACI|nr:hypothetical protein [Ornithinibacillus halotolerans]GGA76978.1 hypothetical protein GCM10008025_20740 [Ornithinibacillus halotolerans]
MQHNHPLIAYAYHFLAEAIIIFMVFMPVFYHRYFYVPYWSYLAVIVVACIIFTLIKKSNANLFVYVLVAPVLFVTFSMLDYPTIIVILLSGLLVWRYMAIQHQEFIKRESLYILLTVIATIYVTIFVHDSEFMVYPFLQFVILFFGYISSHLVYVVKEDRKQIDRKVPGYFIGILIAGAVLLFATYPILRFVTVTLWDGLISLTGGSILGVSNVLGYFFEVEKRGWPDQDSDKITHDGYGYAAPDESVIREMSGLLMFTIAVVLLFVMVLLIISFFRRQVKKRYKKGEIQEKVSEATFLIQRDSIVEDNKTSIFRRKVKSPNHPIRKLVFQFERKAVKHKKGRKPHETIEDWFKRIGIEEDINIYQSVRYGNHIVNESDQESLKEQLKRMEELLTAK